MYNRVILMGRITKDIELKTTPSGLSVTSFSIAVDRPGGKDKERATDFIDCVAWRQTAEFISRFFSKGKAIFIEGKLQTRSYTDKNGVAHKVVEVVVDQAAFTGEKRQADSSPVVQEQSDAEPAQGAEQEQTTDAGDDYPF
jgi:single-strand DNA-binding protein